MIEPSQSASLIRNLVEARSASLAALFLIAPLLLSTTAVSATAQETIAVLGDSNAAGFGVGAEAAFPSRMERMLNKGGHDVRVVNAGIPGDTFGGMAKRLDRDVPRNAKTVIVQGGYNDLAMGVPAEQSIANMRSILTKLRARHANVVLCGFFRKNWDAIGRQLASQYGARFVPGSTCYDRRHRGADGLHMSASGHEVVAGRLAGVVAGREDNVRKAHRQTFRIGKRAP